MIQALVLMLCMLTHSFAFADVDVDSSLDGQRLDGESRYLLDPTGRLTLAEVQTREHQFAAPDAAGLNFGLRRSGALWVRIPVHNRDDRARGWLLEIGYPHLDRLTLFEPGVNGVTQRSAGDLLPFTQRERQHHNFVFALVEAPRARRAVYLRAETQGLLFVPLRAWEERRYTESSYLEWTILFAFYGIVLVMAAYNLFLFAMSRLREYGLFALVILAEGFTQFVSYGHAFQWLMPEQVELAQRLIPFSLNLSVCINCLFGRHSVIVGKLPLWVRRTLDVLIPLTALCAFLAPVVPYALVPLLVKFCYLGLVPFAGLVVISWRLQRGAAREMVSTGWANAMLLGWLSLLIGVLITGLSVSGYLPSNAFTLHGFLFGASLQFVLITASLSHRLGWLQTELSKVNAQLQGKILDLNAAIDLTQTEASRAASAARAKGEVVATMTHELRTPLNAIINIPQGLQQDFGDTACARCGVCNESFVFEEGDECELPAPCPSCGSPDALVADVLPEYVGDPVRSIRYLGIVENAGNHLLRVVQRILDPVTESGELQIAPLDVVPLMSEVADQMNVVATQAGVELRVEPGALALWLLADPLRLRQVLINLIGNAIKFSDGKGVVTVRARAEGPSAVFSVQDQGIGIAEDKRAGIFESFEQGHDPGLRRFGGTGLGLSIARSLVSLHGGEIWLDSKLGQGTTFHFSIPLANAGAGKLQAHAS